MDAPAPTLEIWRFFSRTLDLLAGEGCCLVVWRAAAQVVRLDGAASEVLRGVPKVIAVMMIKHGLAECCSTGEGFTVYRITRLGREVLQAGSDEIERLREANERLRLDLECKPCIGDLAREEAEWFGNVPVPEGLTPTGLLLFVKLHSNLGRIVPKAALEDALYGPDSETRHGNNLSVQISHLRKRLSGTRWRIDTHWGRGFALVEATTAGLVADGR